MLFLEIYHQILYTLLSILYIYLTNVVFRDLPLYHIHVALYILHLFDTCCFQWFTIRSYTRGSLYYTFIWHMLFSEIYHQVPYTWLSMLYIYLTHVVFRDLPSDPIHVALYSIHSFDTCCFQRFTIRSYTRCSLYYTFIWHTLILKIYNQILYTLLSILYIYLTHVVFRDLPSDLIHVALYIIHLFDTCCFQRFTIRSYTRCSLYYTFSWDMSLSEIYHQVPYMWLSILYIYLTHVLFRDLAVAHVHVALYIIHSFGTCCF
jgi:hypothetical protein